MGSPHLGRPKLIHIDGTPIFQNDEDSASEERLAVLVGKAFECEIRRWGKLAPVDWYAIRHERVIGVLELKTRPVASSEVAVTLISVRKWLSLTLAAVGMGVPAIYVIELNDGIRWISLSELPSIQPRMGGRKDRPDSPGALEPVFYVPIGLLKPLRESK